MMEKQVNVLISTYNGEKYIEDQIRSIKAQSYSNIKIYIRDDGSSDQTISILREYEKKGEVVLLKGGANIKWGQSFMRLLEASSDGHYWAFCDQDDVWMPQKIQWAVEWLELQDSSKPLLFHSAFELVSEDLQTVTGVHAPVDYSFDFRRAITDCLYQGFSIVLNQELRKLMLQAHIPNISSHDWWACFLVTKFGISYFDGRIGSKHRRLESSMSGGSFKSKIVWFKSTFSSGNSDICNCAKEFERVFGCKIKDRDCHIAKWFGHDHYHFLDSCKKAFYPKRWRANLSSEISIRILMLCGRI